MDSERKEETETGKKDNGLDGQCYNSYGTCREMSHTYTVHHCMSIINSLVCFYFCCCLAKNRFLSYLNVCMMLSPVTFLIAPVQYM